MRRAIGILATLLLAPGAQAQPQFRNYTAPGNLESTARLGCIAQADAKGTYNPVDLFLGARACIDSDQYERAFDLFSLANIFGRYDMERVADRTAHQAVIVARMQIFGNLAPEKAAKFQTVAKAAVEDPARTQAMCRYLRRIGPPTYHPRYMIQHGMNAFSGGSGGAQDLVPDFSAAAAWSRVLDTYVHCPAA